MKNKFLYKQKRLRLLKITIKPKLNKATIITTKEVFQYKSCHPENIKKHPSKIMDLQLSCGNCFYVDLAYLNYKFEKKLWETKGIKLIAERKSNSLKPLN